MAAASVNQPTREHRGMEYFFALKSKDSDKWVICNKRFVLSIDEHVFGEYLTTMWFNCLMKDTSYEFMIVKLHVGSDYRQRNQIAYQINLGINYHNIPNVFLYGQINFDYLKETKNKIANMMSGETYAMASIPIRCDLIIGDKNNNDLIITMQGSYTSESPCDEPEIMYTFTLPMFKTSL